MGERIPIKSPLARARNGSVKEGRRTIRVSERVPIELPLARA